MKKFANSDLTDRQPVSGEPQSSGAPSGDDSYNSGAESYLRGDDPLAASKAAQDAAQRGSGSK